MNTAIACTRCWHPPHDPGDCDAGVFVETRLRPCLCGVPARDLAAVPR